MRGGLNFWKDKMYSSYVPSGHSAGRENNRNRKMISRKGKRRCPADKPGIGVLLFDLRLEINGLGS